VLLPTPPPAAGHSGPAPEGICLQVSHTRPFRPVFSVCSAGPATPDWQPGFLISQFSKWRRRQCPERSLAGWRRPPWMRPSAEQLPDPSSPADRLTDPARWRSRRRRLDLQSASSCSRRPSILVVLRRTRPGDRAWATFRPMTGVHPWSNDQPSSDVSSPGRPSSRPRSRGRIRSPSCAGVP